MALQSLLADDSFKAQLSSAVKTTGYKKHGKDAAMCTEAAFGVLLSKLTDGNRDIEVPCPDPFQLLDCTICNGFLIDPRTLSCGHSYCSACLMANGAEQIMCRLCGTKTTAISDIQKNLSLDSLLSKIHSTRSGSEMDMESEESTLSATSCESTEDQRHFGLCHYQATLLIKNGNSAGALELISGSRTCTLNEKQAVKLFVESQAYIAQGDWHQAVVCLALASKKDLENPTIINLLKETLMPYLNMTDVSRGQQDDASCYVEEKMSSLVDSIRRTESQTTGENSCEECTVMWKRFRECGITPGSELQCAVCTRIFLKPISLRCGHSFCCECLERSLDFRSVCPLCRSSAMEVISTKDKKADIMLTAAIKELFPAALRERIECQAKEVEIFRRASTDDAEEIPIFVCSLALPMIQCMFHIFEPRYRYMLRKCMETGSQQFGMCMYDEQSGFAAFGTMVEVKQWQLFDDGRSAISCVGGRRFKVLSRDVLDGFHTAKVSWIKDIPLSISEAESVGFLSQQLYKSCEDLFLSLPVYAQEHLKAALGPMPNFDQVSNHVGNGPAWLWWVMQFVVVDDVQRLHSLGMDSLRHRLMLVASCISHFL